MKTRWPGRTLFIIYGMVYTDPLSAILAALDAALPGKNDFENVSFIERVVITKAGPVIRFTILVDHEGTIKTGYADFKDE